VQRPCFIFSLLITSCASNADVANEAHTMCLEYCRIVGGTPLEIEFKTGCLGSVHTSCTCVMDSLYVDPE
jgi:hypothetical protein